MSVIDLGHVPPTDLETNQAAPPAEDDAQGNQPGPPTQAAVSGQGERTGVTLPELLHLADHLDVALPFAVPGIGSDPLADRLGAGGTPLPDLLAAFPDPRQTLLARGLLARPAADAGPAADVRDGTDPGSAEGAGGQEPAVVMPWLLQALRVLNGAEISVDLEVSLAGKTVRAWHHAAGDTLATLSSANGVVYEVALLPLNRWHEELARVLTPPEAPQDEAGGGTSGFGGTGGAGRTDAGSRLQRLSGDTDPATDRLGVPDGLLLPLELLMAGSQALEEGRADVLNELLRRYAGQPTVPTDGAVTRIDEAATLRHLQRLGQATGRARALVTSRRGTDSMTGTAPTAASEDAPRTAPTSVGAVAASDASHAAGVLSWVLLEDGWRHLRPVGTADDPQVRVERVEPGDLGPCLSPLMAQVLR